MVAQFTFEWLLFTRNIKNRLIFIIFLIAAVYYGLVIAPDFQPLYSFADEDTISERIDDQQYLLEIYPERPYTVESAYNIIEQSEIQREALIEEDWETYFQSTQQVNNEIHLARYGYSVDPRFFDINEPYPGQAAAFWRGYTNVRYTGYWEEGLEDITPSLVEERTVLQTIQRLLQDNLPVILLILLVLLTIDIYTRDKGHTTVFNSKPLSFGKVLWIKTLVVMIGFILILLTGFIALLITIGPRYGLGSFSIPIPVFEFTIYGGEFERISIGSWLLQAIVLLVMSGLGLVRLILWFSILIKQELFNLVAGVSVLFAESLYYSRGIGFFSNIGLLPPTFLSVGSVMMGYHNFLYNSGDIHFMNGVISLGITILVIEILIYLTTRFRVFRRI
ncbi:hypothetical protein [Alkalibacterium olivapovliticus]|uniref:ABC-type Na+ efflux pump permease subunit n=1 Tax=Alkalibacterium olivapovliticus TaxID=99907 RepID=A0A2T0W3Q8_9LACT|nr:hypothetical protein [Alkalibacterium olivapovliticus]PRY80090.1 hypothetical protein CLV38_12226 [Alkalibacterium olivapovliticus]